MSLTGDELTLNERSYSIKNIKGEYFYLGKLLQRSKSYSPFHDQMSLYNNSFTFEYMPNKNDVPGGVSSYFNYKIFTEVQTNNDN